MGLRVVSQHAHGGCARGASAAETRSGSGYATIFSNRPRRRIPLPAVASMPRTVLIVEDTETGLETLELALARLPGVALRLVKTAEEALEFLSDDICALVTDLHLPQMDGFELIEAVR